MRPEIEFLGDGGVDVDAHSIAMAYVLNPQDMISYHVAALLEHEDEQAAGFNSHSLGKGLELGFHSEFNHQFTFHGEFALISENGDETAGAEIGLLYNFSEPFGINIEFGFDEDKNSSFEIGLRYNFH